MEDFADMQGEHRSVRPWRGRTCEGCGCVRYRGPSRYDPEKEMVSIVFILRLRTLLTEFAVHLTIYLEPAAVLSGGFRLHVDIREMEQHRKWHSWVPEMGERPWCKFNGSGKLQIW